jgi:hypothetical protein
MAPQAIRSLALSAIGAAWALVVMAGMAGAAELVMYRSPGCPWCALWDREIGAVYAKTDLGRRAPLRMVDLARGDPSLRTESPIRYSPTFVLAEGGREIGRIEGYPGEAFFWGLLERLLERLPQGGATGLFAPPPGVYLKYDPKRWEPVFGKNHAQSRS